MGVWIRSLRTDIKCVHSTELTQLFIVGDILGVEREVKMASTQSSKVAIVKDDSISENLNELKYYGVEKYHKNNQETVKKIYNMIDRGISSLCNDISDIINPGINTIFIKPNLSTAETPDKLITTDPRVLEAVCKYLKDKLPYIKIWVGDQPSYGPETISEDAFTISKLEHAAKAGGADKIVYFGKSSVGKKRVKVHDGLLVDEFEIYEDIVNADFVINLPKMKTGLDDIVSLGLKNWQGILAFTGHDTDRGSMYNQDRLGQQANHRADLPLKLVDIHKAVKANLTIVDGIWAMEGQGPWHGNRKVMNTIIIGEDVVAVDATSCKCMGIDPFEVSAVRCGDTYGLGNAKEENITLVGDPLNNVVKYFKRACPNPIGLIKNVHVHVGATCHGCLSNIRGGLDTIKKHNLQIEKLKEIHIFCGMDLNYSKSIKPIHGLIIVVGDCSFIKSDTTSMSTYDKIKLLAGNNTIITHKGCADVRIFVDLPRLISDAIDNINDS